ncbi:hypothetical protein GCM10007890_57290 [Methylobacterium tardum]|uniref:Uncharacterized protein n=1 Tax=Methylobacterium tardum TaxID=374432 RepID=A0AA37TMP1_9HYPH|nr:hypothetical protein GCM10007890_57290 [Methylobacterium tardum]
MERGIHHHHVDRQAEGQHRHGIDAAVAGGDLVTQHPDLRRDLVAPALVAADNQHLNTVAAALGKAVRGSLDVGWGHSALDFALALRCSMLSWEAIHTQARRREGAAFGAAVAQ